ncbi:hypothetical protein CPB84DRAFT_1822515 [Gymnopilus junonius]|uniref:Zn(2)-C6 fungal-type domain-containing protein n=1 Tax=Gymnopilus junonius TaxID=109634 RepID=A0A9P5TRF6_GYMJU|nr:hypothetical protein CPB84DRAFT_1822515 [Gymnopilus junonius]
MPAMPKSPRAATKKANALPKPKGAVRAKSGCYTCRIRRKKCDEKRMGGLEDGPCETCLRLKLECLGFGAKRPDWLRETSRVSEIRDRIKAHLAAQGMIKGHAGSGSRSAVHDDILRLSDFRDLEMPYGSGGSSSSASTPRRAESVESDSYPHPSRLMLTSTARGAYDPYPHHIDHYPVHSDIPSRSHSPYDSAMNSSVHDFANDYLYPSRAIDTIIETPATRSSFSGKGLYEYKFPEEWDDLITLPEDMRTIPINPDQHIPREFINISLRYYVDNVVKIQYLLGDGNVLPTMIWNAITNHDDSHEAVYLLSKAYHGRQENPYTPVLADESVRERVDNLKASLVKKDGKVQRLSADDAMTALHVVSLFLFDGGGGNWKDFLQLAVRFVEFVLEDDVHHRNYPAALEAASPKVEFVIKTTIWFDVLASITTQRAPLLLYYIRELFRPDLSWVGHQHTYTMMSPMGCENIVVWALAETSWLAFFKAEREKTGTLSIPDLVRRVADIDQYLRPGPRPEPPQRSNEEWSRLFLKTVESGDFPEVPDIKDAADDTYRAIINFPKSLVFGIFICGSLTNDPDRRRTLQMQLQQNTGSDGVGNVKSVVELLSNIWDVTRRPPYGGKLREPVRWRKLLAKDGILLV